MVDPIVSFSLLAQLFTSLAQLMSERKDQSNSTINEYLEWLRRRNHADLAEQIQQLTGLHEALDALLQRNHNEVIAAFKRLNDSVVEIASGIPMFEQVVLALPTARSLSNQAIQILNKMNEIGATVVQGFRTRKGYKYRLEGNQLPAVPLEVEESHHLDEDLRALVEGGYLNVESEEDYSIRYKITRPGCEFSQEQP